MCQNLKKDRRFRRDSFEIFKKWKNGQVKSKYRKWLAQQKLFGHSTTEEQAVQQVNSIYLNLSQIFINHGWWKSGLQKFRNLKSDQDLEITDDYVQQELNEKLETALVLSEN